MMNCDLKMTRKPKMYLINVFQTRRIRIVYLEFIISWTKPKVLCLLFSQAALFTKSTSEISDFGILMGHIGLSISGLDRSKE